MKFYYKISTFFIILLALFSCGENNKCIKSNGNLISEERTISGFNTLEIRGKLNVELKNGTENKITVNCGKNLVNFIKTEVNDSVLLIDNENKCSWLRSYKNGIINLTIETSDLKHLKINGLGRVYSNDTIYSDNLLIEFITGISDVDLTLKTTILEFIVHDGGGDIIIRGKSQNTNIFCNGYPKLNMLDLTSNYVFLASKSQNKTFIRATNRIDVEIYNVGDVYYAGNPVVINLTRYSEGKLINLD